MKVRVGFGKKSTESMLVPALSASQLKWIWYVQKENGFLERDA